MECQIQNNSEEVFFNEVCIYYACQHNLYMCMQGHLQLLQ